MGAAGSGSRDSRPELRSKVSRSIASKTQKRLAGIDPAGRFYFVLYDVYFHLDGRIFPMQKQGFF